MVERPSPDNSFWKDEIIAEEKNENEFYFRGNDKQVFSELIDEIHQTSTSSYRYYYLAQFDHGFYRVGGSSILLKYVDRFESEHIRMLLMRKIVYDKKRNKVKLKDLDRLVMDLYHHFRASPYYILPPQQKGNTNYIYIAYDNNLRNVLTPKIVPEIIELLKNLREVFILPLTANKIAKKYAPKELEEIMVSHLLKKEVTMADVGFLEEGYSIVSFNYIAKQTKFNAIECLEYYPSEENVKVIMEYADHPNESLAKYARESAEKMKKKLLEMQG